LTITEAGKKVYEQSVLMVNAAQQVIDISEADHTELVGSITVAAPEAYLNSVLQPYILPFLDQYPDIQLKLRAVDGDIDLNQNIDIAFRLTDQPHENQVLKEIRKTNLVLCASPDYLKKKGTPSHPTQLNDHDCLYLAETTNDHSWDFLKDDEFHTVSVSGRYAVNHSQMRLAGVKGGLGIGIFHDFVVKDALESGSVIEVLPDWTLKSNYHGAVAMQYAQTKYMPARLRVFIDYIVDKLSND
jgi:DNA-binding transcriptional LysR family regulator